MKKKIRTDEVTVSANIRLDTRRERANKTFPTKLEVYFKGSKKRYDLKTYFTSDDWEKINSPKLKDESLKKRKNGILLEKTRADRIIVDLKNDFTFLNFEQLFFDLPIKRSTHKDDVYNFFEKHIKLLDGNNQLGYAESFTSTLNALKLYCPTLKFKTITPTFLSEFEELMISRNKSITTVGIYMRNIRVIFNLAIDEGHIKHEDYPFGKHSKKKYEIPSSRNIKKALPEEDIKKIVELDNLSEAQEHARDIWVFSFLCNGMNVVDICHLKYKDLDGDFFTFLRVKTSGKQRIKTPIEVYITDKASQIISKWGNPVKEKDDYVFPFFSNGLTIKEKHKIVKNLTRSINYYMKKIATQLELNIKLTTYVARHSYCTILRDNGVNVSEISENVGHTTVATTANYLDRFSQNRKKNTANIINKILTA